MYEQKIKRIISGVGSKKIGIGEAMKKLKSDQREIIRLRFLSDEEYTFNDIGEIINKTGSRAEQINQKALETLRYEKYLAET